MTRGYIKEQHVVNSPGTLNPCLVPVTVRFRKSLPWEVYCCQNVRTWTILLCSSKRSLRTNCAHTLWQFQVNNHFRQCYISQTQVREQSHVCPRILNVRSEFSTLLHLLSCFCHSALRHFLSVSRFKILHTILPHNVDSSQYIHRVSPSGYMNFQQLSPASR